MNYDELKKRIDVLQKYAGAFVLADQILSEDLKIRGSQVLLIVNTSISPDEIEFHMEGGCQILTQIVNYGRDDGRRLHVNVDGVLTDAPCSKAMDDLFSLGVLGIVERQTVRNMFEYLAKSIFRCK